MNSAAIDDCDPIGDRGGAVIVVGCVDHGCGVVAIELPEFEAKAFPQLEVEGGKGLVQEIEPRPSDDRTRDRDPLTLTAAQRLDVALQQMIDLQRARGICHTPVHLGLILAKGGRAEG